MTVTNTLNRKDFTGDGSTTAFAFTFNYFATSDVAVYLDDVKQTEVTDYTVAPASGTSGTVTMVIAPASGVLVTIIRELPLTQGIDLPTAGKFPADTVEEGLDKAMAAISDLSEKIDRATLLPISSTLTNISLPGPGASKGFRWDAAGLAIELVTFSTLGTFVDPVTTRGDLVRGSTTGDQERLALGTAKKYLKSDGTDAVWDEIVAIKESGGQVLDVVAVADDEFLKRSGTTLVGATVAGGLSSLQVITSTGTWTRPAGVKRVLVYVIGAGGGGGGADTFDGTQFTSAGGGGGGGTALKFLDVSSIATSTITIGAAGAAGSATGGDGGAGTNSVWSDGTNTLTGVAGLGGRGTGGPSVSTYRWGGQGGVPTGGDLNSTGGAGHGGAIVEPDPKSGGFGGTGGATLLGGAGRGAASLGSGANPGWLGIFGGGGGGAVNNKQTTGAVGGVGGAGLVFVLEFK